MRLFWYFLALIIFLLVFATYKTIIQINPLRDSTFIQHKNVVKVNDLYNYGFDKFNSEICSNKGKGLKLFIAVMSPPENEAKRLAIRKTWGNLAYLKNVSIVFFIGTTIQNGSTDSLIREDWIYKDLIRCKSEEKLTLKTVHMLEWARSFCSEAEFLMKTEDDVIVNVLNLLELVSVLDQKSRVIYGRRVRNLVPIRSRFHIDYVPLEEYLPNIYPDFMTGPSYLLPTRLAEELFSRSLRHTYLRLADIFLTGIVANNLGIGRVDLSSSFNIRLSKTDCKIRKAISINILDESELYEQWIAIHNTSSNCTENITINSTQLSWKKY